MVAVCSIAIQSSRNLLFFGCFSFFGLRLFLVKWCEMNMFAIIVGDLFLTVFCEMAYPETTKTHIVTKNKPPFLVERHSQKSFTYLYEVILLIKVALHLLWISNIWIVEFGNFVTLLDLEMSCLWCACRCRQCTGFQTLLNFLSTSFSLF